MSVLTLDSDNADNPALAAVVVPCRKSLQASLDQIADNVSDVQDKILKLSVTASSDVAAKDSPQSQALNKRLSTLNDQSAKISNMLSQLIDPDVSSVVEKLESIDSLLQTTPTTANRWQGLEAQHTSFINLNLSLSKTSSAWLTYKYVGNLGLSSNFTQGMPKPWGFR